MTRLQFGYKVGPTMTVVDINVTDADSTIYEAIRAAVEGYPEVASAEWVTSEGHQLRVTWNPGAERRGDLSSYLGYWLRQQGVLVPEELVSTGAAS